MVVDVVYEGRPHGLEFVVGDRRVQHMIVRNNSAHDRIIVKIQCTSSRKFRVRPGLAVLTPHASVAVQIQLAPHERDASECKFLLVARRIDPADESNVTEDNRPQSSSIKVLEAAQQQRDVEDKALWQRTETHGPDSLVHSETIVARIVLVASESTTTIHENTIVEPLRYDSLETRAHVVQMLMKNQSRLVQNQLHANEKAALRQLQRQRVTDWDILNEEARRMRALVRQYTMREKAMSTGQ